MRMDDDPLMGPGETSVKEGAEALVQIFRRGSGYAARGACFYLWDEDAGELLRTAAALADAVRTRPRRAALARRAARRPPRLA
jgi:hypothetical protein